jgi:photosystem II stability/assembly factor-like uncharacterized protein
MKKQWFAITITVATAMTALLGLFWLMGNVGFGIPGPALGASAERDDAAAPLSLTVTAVDPAVAPNDLDTPIIITGTGFTAELSGTLVITQPTAYLGATALEDVIWVSTTTLTATVPWGMSTGTYTLTVTNPGGEAGSLADAFTVTQGIGVWTTGGPYGGYIVGIEKKPGTPTTVYALASDVGLFLSENSGGQWRLGYSTDYMSRLAFDSQNSDVIYLGTWRSHTFARSLDGGQTWETPPQIGYPGHGNSSYPATHPTDAGKVFVGIGDAFSELPPGEGGVFRSDDYGLTWITKTNGMTDTQVQSIAIHPNDPDKMLAGTFDGNLYVSTDGGESWSLSAHLDGPVIAVYFNPYQPLEAWASASEEVHGPPYLYTSTNLVDWTPIVIDPGAPGCWPSRWDLTFLTDTIWASAGAIYTSTDSAASWTYVSGQPDGVNVVAVTPDNPQEVYVGTQEGVDKSQDGGQTWQPIDEGLAGVVPYAIAVARTDPDTVYVAADPNGILRSFNGGHAWQDVMEGGAGGWGEWLVADAYTPTRVYLGGRFQHTDAFCIEISTDAAETWHLVTATLPVTYAGWESAAYALVSHPQVPGRLLAGSWVWPPDSAPWLEDTLSLVYASDDYGQSWTRVGPTQPISPVVDIAYDAVDPGLVYMATEGSGLWKSTDGGNTWQLMPKPGGQSEINGIAPHPTISGYLVVGVSGGEYAGVYSSQDAGETWTFLDSYVGTPLVYTPSAPPVLYGRRAIPQYWGLVRSYDNGQTWEQMPDAPYPNCLATGTDGERVILYIGSPGGLPSQTGAQTAWQPNAILGESTVFGGGVYRMTTRLPNHWAYLPLVLRGYAP